MIRDNFRIGVSLVLGGPSTDYSTYWSESALAAPSTADCRATYTFTRAMPAEAKGSYSSSLEGYRRTVTISSFGNLPVTVHDSRKNFVKTFPVDNSPMVPRAVVSLAKCNNGHFNLSLHAGNRNQIEACVICHNPVTSDAVRRPAAMAPNESIHFGTIMHRIHAGNKQIRDFIIFGFGGSVNNFNAVGFPNELTDCAACHINGSERLPLAETNSDVQDPCGLVRRQIRRPLFAAAATFLHKQLPTSSTTPPHWVRTARCVTAQ